MKKSSAKSSKAVESSFEEKIKRLEAIIQALESPEITLEDGMALYREGVTCSRACRQQLELARHELEVWQNDEAAQDISDFSCPGEGDDA